MKQLRPWEYYSLGPMTIRSNPHGRWPGGNNSDDDNDDSDDNKSHDGTVSQSTKVKRECEIQTRKKKDKRVSK